MKMGYKVPVRIFPINQLAKGEQDRRFDALAQFVQMGNTVADYSKFGRLWPSFFPVPIGDLEQTDIRDGYYLKRYKWVPEALALCSAYRWLLRKIWVDDQKYSKRLGILLGTEHLFLQRVQEGEPGHGDFLDRFSDGWWQLKIHLPDSTQALCLVSPSWPSGYFSYMPLNEFQEAVFLLFKEAWRAKVCAQCAKYFVADKPARRFCDPACTGEAKRLRNLEWWREVGDQQRQKKRRDK